MAYYPFTICFSILFFHIYASNIQFCPAKKPDKGQCPIFPGKKSYISKQTYIFPRENHFFYPPITAIPAMLRPGTTSGSGSASTGALHLRLAEESLVEVEAAAVWISAE